MAIDVLVWLLAYIGECVVFWLGAVIAWYTIVLASPRAGRAIVGAMLRTVEKREREIEERGR